LTDAVTDDLRVPASCNILSIFWQGLEYVLLYGGPDRQFEPRDSDLLLEEVVVITLIFSRLIFQTVQDFFMCKDEKGVPQGLTAEGRKREKQYFSN
jgi:hypothetical protein